MKEHWDDRYSATEYIYGTKPNTWFSEKLNLLKPGKLLLPAEGEGRNAVYAASQGWDVTAFDQSDEGQKKALKLAQTSNVTIRYMIDGLIKFKARDNEFDAIALIFVHMPAEIRQKVHQKLIRFLKPGGHLILEAFTKSQLKNNSGGPKNEMLLFDKTNIQDDFPNLEFIDFREEKILLNEGPLHQGKANVIRLFSRKPINYKLAE